MSSYVLTYSVYLLLFFKSALNTCTLPRFVDCPVEELVFWASIELCLIFRTIICSFYSAVCGTADVISILCRMSFRLETVFKIALPLRGRKSGGGAESEREISESDSGSKQREMWRQKERGGKRDR